MVVELRFLEIGGWANRLDATKKGFLRKSPRIFFENPDKTPLGVKMTMKGVIGWASSLPPPPFIASQSLRPIESGLVTSQSL